VTGLMNGADDYLAKPFRGPRTAGPCAQRPAAHAAPAGEGFGTPAHIVARPLRARCRGFVGSSTPMAARSRSAAWISTCWRHSHGIPGRSCHEIAWRNSRMANRSAARIQPGYTHRAAEEEARKRSVGAGRFSGRCAARAMFSNRRGERAPARFGFATARRRHRNAAGANPGSFEKATPPLALQFIAMRQAGAIARVRPRFA